MKFTNKPSVTDYYDFDDEYEDDEDDVDENEKAVEEDDTEIILDPEKFNFSQEGYEYDDEYPFFELTGLKVVNYQSAIIISMNISFESYAPSDAVIIPVSITTRSIGRVNSTNSYNQIHKISEGMKQLCSFLVLDAKSKSDLCGKDIELAYYTSEMKLCTALYKCDMYGDFMFMDWKNRNMNEREIADYNKRLNN